MERERGWGGVYGGWVLSLCVGRQIEQCKKYKIKYVMALDGGVTIFHMQQTTKNTWA
jgi:hypothetical protein